ncbi:hypothetical protein P7C73_g5403, partial [Tremellales sp. Uapishka_1]
MRLGLYYFIAALVLGVSGVVAVKPGTTLYTDAVTYCAEAKAVVVDEFDLQYHRANESITFSFSLASVESNLNTSLNVYLNIYGIQAVNTTVDLCSILTGVLCPLPQVNFTGYGTYPVPSKYTKDLTTSSLAKLAWSVPNIEAYVRVELINDDTGEIAACLQTTLSNGWSTRQKAVSWATGAITIFALLVGLLHTGTTNSPSPAQYRFFDVLFIFQSAAVTGLLHLNYPSVYSNFVLNFAWAIGLFRSNSMQASIDKMRMHTGGKLDSTAYSDVQYINRKLSPFNVNAVSLNDITASAQEFKRYLSEDATPYISQDLYSRALIPTVTEQNATSDLTTGVAVYSNTLNIPVANVFDTVFFWFLAFIAIAIAFHVVLYAVVWLVDRFGKERKGSLWAARLRRIWWDFCMGNALRVCLIGFFPLFLFAFYQFHIGESDSQLSLFFAVFAICLVLAPLATVFVLAVIKDRKPSSTSSTISPLYTNWRWFFSVGVLYRAYRQKYHFFWFAPLVLAMIARAGFISFGTGRAWAQVIGCIVVEFLVLLSILVCRPHKDRKGDWLAAFLSVCRLFAFGLLIAFIESMHVSAIIRTIIGFVIIVLFGLPTVLLFFGIFWNLGYGYLWRKHTHRIEDGLEVERINSASDDHSSQQPAMQAVDSRHFVSGIDSPATPHNRNSIMEPIGENTYDSSMQTHRYPSDASTEAPILHAEKAYAEAARGGSNTGHPGTTQMSRQPSSAAGSGVTHYYTPANGVAQSDGNRWSQGEEYFNASNNSQRERY